MTYTLEKQVWTDVDFDQMGWHDSHIYKIRVTEDLELDIDYILQWNKPEIEGLAFTFWVAPATLVFKNISELSFELNTAFDEAVEIQDIEKTQKGDRTHWTIMTHQGDFEFFADGYEQFIRQEPFFQFGQTIPFLERYASSLERTTNQDNPNRNREDILAQRKKDLEDYENLKKRHLKKLEKEQLEKARDNNEIETKQYLLKKKEIKESIDFYNHWLKDTRFENW
ncbi:MAG TPA: hypothetical protein VEY71_13110 [Chitinophagales bacterium]|nr:hypothetical protein [Chitinophagales bacterium]